MYFMMQNLDQTPKSPKEPCNATRLFREIAIAGRSLWNIWHGLRSIDSREAGLFRVRHAGSMKAETGAGPNGFRKDGSSHHRPGRQALRGDAGHRTQVDQERPAEGLPDGGRALSRRSAGSGAFPGRVRAEDPGYPPSPHPRRIRFQRHARDGHRGRRTLLGIPGGGRGAS